jgi:hypothetical protein
VSKMLDKVSKLLAQAENAGTPEEAAAFMDKVQELATAYGIDLAVARAHKAKKEQVQVPEERRVQVNPYTRHQNRKHFMELAMYIAEVNDCEYLIGGGEYVLHAVGFPADLDVVEALYTHLAVQMVMECDAALKAGANKEIRRVPKQKRVPIPEDERPWGERAEDGYYYNDRPGWPNSSSYDAPASRLEEVRDESGEIVYEDRAVAVSDGRAFRHEFYGAFTRRIYARLWEAKRAAEAAAGVEAEGSNETSLAIRDKKEEVSKAHEEQRAKVRHLGVWQGSSADERAYDSSGAGQELGRKSAERVPIGDSREVESS